MMAETPEAPTYHSSTPWKEIVLNSLPVRNYIPGRNLLNLPGGTPVLKYQ